VKLSLGKIWYRYVDTVRGERWSSLPISLFVSPQRHVDVDISQVVVPGPMHADDRGQGSRHGIFTSCHNGNLTGLG